MEETGPADEAGTFPALCAPLELEVAELARKLQVETKARHRFAEEARRPLATQHAAARQAHVLLKHEPGAWVPLAHLLHQLELGASTHRGMRASLPHNTFTKLGRRDRLCVWGTTTRCRRI